MALRALRRAATVAACLAAATTPAVAQTSYSCDPLPSGSAEARLLEQFALPLVFSAIDQPQRIPSGTTTFVLEVSEVPAADNADRVTQCFAANKSQNTNLAAIAPRARLHVGLPLGFQAEVSGLPPVTVGDATPSILQAALAYTFRMGYFAGNAMRVQLRGHYTWGQVRGPVTCPQSALRPADPLAPCWGTEPSRDEYRPRIGGGEAILAVDGVSFGLMAGTGVNVLTPELQVDFTNRNGNRDRSRVIAPRITNVPVLLGGTLRFTERLSLTGQFYTVAGLPSLVRVAAGYRLR
jgi:hypothetical protein